MFPLQSDSEKLQSLVLRIVPEGGFAPLHLGVACSGCISRSAALELRADLAGKGLLKTVSKSYVAILIW